MSISQRRGIISPIPKGESYLVELTNWRPITLLNVDYKILARAFAKRIELKLPKLIHSDQTGFVKGRFIGQGRVVRKPVNVNPGLNVNWGIIFSCLKLFFTFNVWCSLRLLQLKTEGQKL